MVQDKHGVRVRNVLHDRWVTSINLWPGDVEHRGTCACFTTTRRPTDRQIRQFKKTAKVWAASLCLPARPQLQNITKGTL